jgi:hypothetical protein
LPAQTRYFFSKYGHFLHAFVRRFDAQKSLGASSGHHFVLDWDGFEDDPGSGHQPGHHFADQRSHLAFQSYRASASALASAAVRGRAVACPPGPLQWRHARPRPPEDHVRRDARRWRSRPPDLLL